MKLIFIRHGQAKCNKLPETHRLREYDEEAPLNRVGKNQARKLAVLIQEKFPSYLLFTSPLLRAVQTAEILASLTSPQLFKRVDSIREVRARKFHREITVKEWDLFLEERYANPRKEVFGIESILSHYRRICRFCSTVTQEYPNECVIAITHAFSIELAMVYFLGLPLEVLRSFRIHASNTGVFIIDVENGGHEIIAMNSLAHLSRY